MRLKFCVALLPVLFQACGRGESAPSPGAKGASRHFNNIYAFTGSGGLSPIAAKARPLVYVPNSRSASVTVIDPKTYTVIRTFPTGKLPQHVVPSYDLKTLWVANNEGNTLTPIDPATGKDGPRIPVDDPYNMYFTPDGKYAMIIAERLRRIDFRDAQDMHLVQSVPVACRGLDHVDFTADDRYAVATCEFSGQLVKVDLAARKVVGYLTLEPDFWTGLPERIKTFFRKGRFKTESASMPQDIRSSPDGAVFYVADMKQGGVFLIDPFKLTKLGFEKTGIGTHGLYPSRDGKLIYVTNRGSSTTSGRPHGPGSITVLDSSTGKILAKWPLPGGGSPDMGNVTADGRELWLSGRYDQEVYVFDTSTGKLTHRIPVGREPHGLCVWPQPGRYSLGHTGNMR
jgi:YVTN family beta-propeller protein